MVMLIKQKPKLPLLQKTDRLRYVAIDTETTGLSPYHGHRPFAISAAWRSHNDEIATAYVEFPVNPKTRIPDYSKPSSAYEHGVICEILKDYACRKVYHNSKFDIKMLQHSGHTINGPFADTLLMARTCYGLEPSYGLKPLSKKYLQIGDDDQSDLQKAVLKSRNLAKKSGFTLGEKLEMDYWMPAYFFPDKEYCKKYAVLDVIRTLQLYEFYNQGLDELEVRHSYETEIELLPVILKMEERGIRLFYDLNLEKIAETKKLMDEANREFHRACNLQQEININSPKQLLPALQAAGVPCENTTGDDLEKIMGPEARDGGPMATNYPQIYWLLTYRGYSKGMAFFQKYLELAVKDTNLTVPELADKINNYVVHGNFNQGNTRTWRLSASDPNLQQTSNDETSDGFNVVNVRTVFGPRYGYTWYCADYKQLELRIFASRANETKLLEVFNNGGDPHDATRRAVPLLAAKPEKVGRKLAKNTNFSIVNRGGKNCLYNRYGIPLEDGGRIIRELYEAYPNIRQRQEELHAFGQENGYILTAFDRKCHVFPDNCYTTAPAYDIQSSAGDIIKRAMIECNEYLEDTKLDAHLLLSIHDELIFEIKKEHCYKWLLLKLKSIMEDHTKTKFKLPIITDWAKTNTTWAAKSEKGLEWLNNATK